MKKDEECKEEEENKKNRHIYLPRGAGDSHRPAMFTSGHHQCQTFSYLCLQ